MSDSHSTNLLAANDAGEEANAEDKPPSTPWYFAPPHEFAPAHHRERENGLRSPAANRRLQPYRPNTLTASLCRLARSLLVTQFKRLWVVLLLAAAGLAFGFTQARAGFAEQALSALQKQIVPTAHRLRDRKKRQILTTKLIPDEPVALSAGGRVPADERIKLQIAPPTLFMPPSFLIVSEVSSLWVTSSWKPL